VGKPARAVACRCNLCTGIFLVNTPQDRGTRARACPYCGKKGGPFSYIGDCPSMTEAVVQFAEEERS